MPAKADFAMQKAQHQAKLVKPGAITMNHNWNPNVPTSQTDDIVYIPSPEEVQTAQRLLYEDMFDAIMDNLLALPLEQAIEPVLRDMLTARECIVWIDNLSERSLFSPRHNIKTDYQSCLAGFVATTRTLLQVQNQKQCPPGFVSDPKIAEIDSLQLLFPLICGNTVKAIIQIIRPPKSPSFGQPEVDAAKFVMLKFSLYGESLFKYDRFRHTALEFFGKDSESPKPLAVLIDFFGCQSAEIWKYDGAQQLYQIYDRATETLVPVQDFDLGVAGFVLSECKTLNVDERTSSSHYSAVYDGPIEGPVMGVPYAKNKKEIWGAILRGRSRPFTVYEEFEVLSLLPFIARIAGGAFSDSDDIGRRLMKLLSSVSRIVSILDLNELIAVIKEEARMFFDCERTKIVLVDAAKNRLKTGFDLPKPITFPLDVGLVGSAMSENTLLNLPDPTTNEKYLEGLDALENHFPSFLMAVPISDLTGLVVGCLVLINRTSGEAFAVIEEKLAQVFAAFVGVALQKSTQHRMDLKLARLLIARAPLPKILTKALMSYHLARITLFLHGATHSLQVVASIGASLPYGNQLASECAEDGHPILLSGSGIASRIENAKQGEPKFRVAPTPHPILRIMEPQPGVEPRKQQLEETLCCLPLFTADDAIIGVLEFQFYGLCDVSSLKVFAANITQHLLENAPPDLKMFGSEKLDPREWMTDDERIARLVPSKLVLSDDRAKIVFRFQFNLDDWDGIALFQAVFRIFAKFGLMEAFEFSNGLLFNFLNELRAVYRPVKTGSWRHAVDVFQFATVIIAGARLDRVLTKLEIFGLLIAALCHDLGHDGFARSLEARCETEHAQLLSQQSIFEVESCMRAISLVANDECNIFVGLSPVQQKTIWTVIIDCILATDMARHNSILNAFKALQESNDLDPEAEPAHKTLLMQIVLKCADLGGIARPFDTAKQRCKWMGEETYRQGELSGSAGIVYSGQDSKRENVDKAQSFFGFLENVCGPLFEQLVKFSAPLSYMTDHVSKNVKQFRKQRK
jgi:hypothetical protein